MEDDKASIKSPPRNEARRSRKAGKLQLPAAFAILQPAPRPEEPVLDDTVKEKNLKLTLTARINGRTKVIYDETTHYDILQGTSPAFAQNSRISVNNAMVRFQQHVETAFNNYQSEMVESKAVEAKPTAPPAKLFKATPMDKAGAVLEVISQHQSAPAMPDQPPITKPKPK